MHISVIVPGSIIGTIIGKRARQYPLRASGVMEKRLPCPATDSAARDVDRIHSGFEIRGIDCRDALIRPEGFSLPESLTGKAHVAPQSLGGRRSSGYRSSSTQERLCGINDFTGF